jgi:predicted DNA-binding transcriptional regulator YafY
MGSAWTRYVVEAVVAAPGEHVRARIGRWATVTDAGPGRCSVRIEGDDLDWAVAALGLTGADYAVLSPPEVREHLLVVAARHAAAAR